MSCSGFRCKYRSPLQALISLGGEELTALHKIEISESTISAISWWQMFIVFWWFLCVFITSWARQRCSFCCPKAVSEAVDVLLCIDVARKSRWICWISRLGNCCGSNAGHQSKNTSWDRLKTCQTQIINMIQLHSTSYTLDFIYLSVYANYAQMPNLLWCKELFQLQLLPLLPKLMQKHCKVETPIVP